MAMKKNGEYIGDRYVRLLHVSKQEMNDQVKFGTAAIPKPGQVPHSAIVPAALVQSAIHQQLAGLYHALGQGSMQVAPGSGMMPLGWSSSSALPQYLQNICMPSSVLSASGQAAGVPTGLSPGLPPTPAVEHDGRSVKIRGLPFRATRDDILYFFNGYDVVPDSLHIGLDTSGRPTGDGWVTFATQEEAKRAVREKNKEYLQHRYLELTAIQ